MRARRGGLARFAAVVGQGRSERGDIAGSYKARLAKGWGDKHRTAGALRLHESQAGYGAGAPPAKGRA